ncbi:MAG: ABC transporter permease [Propionibacteriaceae bacterium]|nr:ABC transporter permease [Propionibacteriaceae bacterium]
MTAPARFKAVIDHTVVADHQAVRRWGWFHVVEHMVLRMRSYVATMLMTGIGSPFLYLMGLGFGLGVLVDQGKGIDGVPYLTFVAPALVMATAMQVGAQENTYGVFGGFKWTNMFNAMRLSPISPGQMAMGMQAGTLVRVGPMLLFYLLAVMLFGIATPWQALLMFPVGLLLALATGCAVMAWVATQKDDRGQLSFIERFVIVPLTLFSGTYFPLETLPGYLQPIGWISPLWHAAELGRAAIYDTGMSPLMGLVHVAFLLAVAAVGALLSVRTFRNRLDQ